MLTRRAAYLLAVPVALVLFGYVLYPSIRTFITGWGWDNYSVFVAGWRSANVQALVNSVSVSILSVIGAGFLGTGLAYSFFRFNFPLKKSLLTLAAVPLALPPLVGVMAFLFLYGESGILPRGIQALLDLDEVPFAFEGYWAVLLVHIYVMYVYFYLFVLAALRNVDGSLLEASADMGASSWYTFRRIIVPLMRPALAGAALLVFMISMASFTAPLLFDGAGRYLTTQIYNYKTAGNLALSATVSTVLTVISLVFLLLLEWRRSRMATVTAAKGTSVPPRPVTRGLTRWIAASAAFLMILFLLLPILTVFLISFAEEGSWTFQLLPERYTFDNYLALFGDSDFAEPIWNSVRLAVMATVANLFFGIAAAWVISKTRVSGRSVIRILSMLPFAIPGTVIALNLIVTFNQSTPLGFGQVLVGTFWILPLAYFIRHIPLIVRSTMSALESFDDRLTEASSDLGAKALTTFRKVVLPVIGPAIMAGTLLTFVTALGEFVSSIMLYIVGNRPISVEILAQLRLYNFGAAAAYSVFLMLLIGLASLVVRRISGAGSASLQV